MSWPMNRRAYLITILTYVLIASTLAVGYFYHQSGRSGDLGPVKALEKISALKSDVASDLSDIYGLDAALGNGRLVLNDSYRTGMQANLNSYKSYLEGDYATLLQANVSLSTPNLSFSLWPQNVTYGYTDENKSSVRLYCQNSEISAYTVGIRVTNENALSRSTNDTSAGTFPFSLNVKNSAGTSLFGASANLSSAYCNQYLLNFTDGNWLTVQFGACSGLNRTLIITRSGARLNSDLAVSTLASNQSQFTASPILAIRALRNVTSSERVVLGRS